VENIGQKRNALLPSSRQDICNNSSGGHMRGSKPVMQKSPVSYGAHSVPAFFVADRRTSHSIGRRLPVRHSNGLRRDLSFADSIMSILS
jgi:hypothetical protein